MRNSPLLATLALALVGTAAIADERHHPAAEAPAPAAQAPAAPSVGMMPGGMCMMMHKADGAIALTAPRRLEGRIAYLHAEIAPTPDQEAAFADVVDALRAAEQPAQGAASHQHGAAEVSVSLAHRLAAEEHTMASRLKTVQALRAAFTRLDASLSPEQRATAAELLPLLFPSAL